MKAHGVRLVAVGSGTGGRETLAFVREQLGAEEARDGSAAEGGPVICLVSEAGASVYSASEVARREFPDLDVTVRGAISIARRLQDPLAELVKIDPRSIGVGQYQHDVEPGRLDAALREVVESCVNRVGVDVNLASRELLRHVSGLSAALAEKIVRRREERGPLRSRAELREIPGLGAKTFQQAAGFLRVSGAENPLDGSAVHPERYGFVERLARSLGVPLPALIGDRQRLRALDPARLAGEEVGPETLRDILAELEKPGRDPRAEFRQAALSDAVRTIEDLKPGLELEGTVTNVTRFGAFVDLGVHQDGLVHVSELADRFVRDPAEVVKTGQIVEVRVLEVDLERQAHRPVDETARLRRRGDGDDGDHRRAGPVRGPLDRAEGEDLAGAGGAGGAVDLRRAGEEHPGGGGRAPYPRQRLPDPGPPVPRPLRARGGGVSRRAGRSRGGPGAHGRTRAAGGDRLPRPGAVGRARGGHHGRPLHGDRLLRRHGGRGGAGGSHGARGLGADRGAEGPPGGLPLLPRGLPPGGPAGRRQDLDVPGGGVAMTPPYPLSEIRTRLHAHRPHLRTLREFRHGAVIVPLLEREGRLELLFELRSPRLSRHAGLVSFPGGGVEDGESPLQAALREMHEEVGISPELVEPLGELDTVEGISGDRISPFVCRVGTGYRLAPREIEVQEVFTVPLDLLLERGFREAALIQEYHPSPDFPAHLLPPGSLPGRHSHPVLYLEHEGRLIWGLTARIAAQFLELLRGAPPP